MSNAETLSLYQATCVARHMVARNLATHAAPAERSALRSLEVKCLREAIRARASK